MAAGESVQTDLGSGTVNDTPDSGLVDSGTSVSDVGGFELDRLRQSGSEYDFLMSLGMRDWTTGSGMRTQMSSGSAVATEDLKKKTQISDVRVWETQKGRRSKYAKEDSKRQQLYEGSGRCGQRREAHVKACAVIIFHP